MSNLEKKNMVCGSLYHRWWFRVILFIVAVDMLIFGVLFAVGVDIMSLIPKMNMFLHILFGSMYVVVSLFIIYLLISYRKIKNHVYFVCHRCSRVDNK